MPATIFGNSAAALGLYQAFYGKAPAYATFVNNVALSAQSGTSALAAAVAANFNSTAPATIASTVLTNVGITNTTLQDALTQYFTAYTSAATRGQVVLNLVTLLSGLEGDAVYGAAASNWNKLVTSNNAYSSNSTNVSDVVINANVVNLTNGVDVVSGNIFNASRGYTPGGTDQVNTLNDDDVLTGTGTNATLNLTFVDDVDLGAGTVITPTLSGVPVVNISVQGAVAKTLDLQDTTGVTDVNVSRVNNTNFTAQNIASASEDLSITNSQATGSTITFNYLRSALAGTADSTTLTLSNVNVANVVVEQIGATGAAADTGYETINLVSSGAANTVATSLTAEDIVTLNISGDKNITLGGFTRAAGSMKTINASTLTANSDLTVNGQLSAIADGTSGVDMAMTVTQGVGADTLRVTDDTIGNNDVVAMGEGADTAAFSAGATRFLATGAGTGVTNATGVEAITVTRTNTTVGADQLTLALDRFDGNQTVRLTNGSATANDGAVTFNVINANSTEAAAITVAHSATGNNNITENIVNVDVDATATAVGVTLVDGTNTDGRFNFVLAADSDMAVNATTGAITNLGNTTNAVASVTITDNDTEMNTVALAEVARHFGTVTVAGTSTQTLNLDTTTAGANGGLYRFDTTDFAAGTVDGVGVQELSNTANQVKFVGATFTSAAYAGNVVLRTNTSQTGAAGAAAANTATGAQTITLGAGADTLIFDAVNDNRAGLTISDTVAGGAGSDALVIDGQGVAVTLGASEWTNVTGFETIRVIGNGAANNNARGATNAYNLTLTNELVAGNGVSGMINIVNDNDTANDTLNAGDTGGTAVEDGVTIDARVLTAANSFTYNGEEGASRTADRFIFADANMNGKAVIDGGANLGGGNSSSNAANADVIEVRNASVVTVGDLLNIRNVGTLEFTNDTASAQNHVLQLNNDVVDALVNSSRAAATGFVETLTIRTFDNALVANANSVMNMDASQVTNAFLSLAVTTTAGADSVIGGAGADTIVTAAGNDTINGGAGIDVITGGTGNDDITGGTEADTMVMALADSTARSAEGLTAGALANGETITFGNGVDVIRGFVSGVDKLDVATANAVTTFAAGGNASNLGANSNAAVRGDFNAGTGVFTVAAAGADMMVVTNAVNADIDAVTQTGIVILIGTTSVANVDFI